MKLEELVADDVDYVGYCEFQIYRLDQETWICGEDATQQVHIGSGVMEWRCYEHLED